MNAMSIQKRKYELRARAERQAETRRRIAAATAALHDEVGPARTTVAEIARRAGVQRLTVYKNFAHEYELFVACQQHFLAENPPPDPSAAFAIADPGERLEAVLRQLYRWYRRTERTSGNVRRDREIIPALDSLMADTTDARAAELTKALGRLRQRAKAEPRSSCRGRAGARLLDLASSRERKPQRRRRGTPHG